VLVIAAMSNLDPVTLTVIQNGLIQVCNEMDLAFVRSAFSPVISEGMDRSDGIYDATDGSLIAQGELGLPVFVGTMQFSSRAVIDRVKSHYAGKVDPGDVFIVNDPYLGGTHLMDVRFVKPFFYRGELFAWLANTGHWPDVGGMVPGGFSASATEVEQEGLRLPPVKFWKKGEMDQEILSIILSNIRIADQRIGDIKAQAAALTTGEVRLTALIDRYGAEVVRQAIAEMRHRAERQMRAKISGIPDGVYEGTSQIDSDGVVDLPLTIKMKITKKGEELLFERVRDALGGVLAHSQADRDVRGRLRDEGVPRGPGGPPHKGEVGRGIGYSERFRRPFGGQGGQVEPGERGLDEAGDAVEVEPGRSAEHPFAFGGQVDEDHPPVALVVPALQPAPLDQSIRDP